MEDETYNGWSNRETWAIQLHLSNNEGDYVRACEAAAEFVSTSDGRDRQINYMADFIKDWTEEVFSSVINADQPGMYPNEASRLFVSDVGSWWRADFHEIAEHWIDEASEASPS